METEPKFNSIVNNVTLIKNEHESFVCKQFYPYAVKTKIRVPIERAIIEFKINNFIKEHLLEDYTLISVPKILDYFPSIHVIKYELIEGVRPFDLPNINNVPQIVWQELYKFLKRLSSIKQKQVNELFLNSMSMTTKIQKTLFAYNFPNKNLIFTNECLCLGDVNLSNMIWNGKKLYLFDFETAHLGAYGFDIGQISAQLKIKFDKDFLLEKDEQVQYWHNLFLTYYKTKNKWKIS